MILKSRVALSGGKGRYENILHCLNLLRDEIDLDGKSTVVIKPNLVSSTRQLASTHPEALHAVLEFLRQRFNGKIIIGEGTGEPAFKAYRNFGYVELAERYGAKLVDLSEDGWVEVKIYDRHWQPLSLRFSRTVAEAAFRISLAPAKTHNDVIVTLSLKNLAMGSLHYKLPSGSRGWLRGLLRRTYKVIPPFVKYFSLSQKLKSRVVELTGDNDRLKVHQGYALHHVNLFLLARAFPPHLGIIDGYEGMEGDGPDMGSSVPFNVAVASRDFVAADSLAAYLMGFESSEIGYLWYAGRLGLGALSLGDMEIAGDIPERWRRAFKPHPTYQQQLQWKEPRAQALLGIS